MHIFYGYSLLIDKFFDLYNIFALMVVEPCFYLRGDETFRRNWATLGPVKAIKIAFLWIVNVVIIHTNLFDLILLGVIVWQLCILSYNFDSSALIFKISFCGETHLKSTLKIVHTLLTGRVLSQHISEKFNDKDAK